MLAKRVIACLDVDAGRVVKGTKFQDMRDAGDPVVMAARYYREGGRTVFWSRSRQELWRKGATSHTGERSCFFRELST